MSSYQISLPLKRSSERGFEHVTSVIQSVVQDFKSLLLTIPGEKISDPSFGVGLPRFLFEFPTELVKEEIRQTITEKTSRYLPFIRIKDIFYDVDGEKLLVAIAFFVGSDSTVQQILLDFSLSSEGSINSMATTEE